MPASTSTPVALAAAAAAGALLLAPAFLAPGAASHGLLRGAEGPSTSDVHRAGGFGSATVGAAVFGAAALTAASRRVGRSSQVPRGAEFEPSAQVGVTAPLGFFDPLGFTKKGDEDGFLQLRKSEIKHGRVAMLAVLGFLGQTALKFPGFENVPSGISAQLQEPGSNGLLVLFFLSGYIELGLNVWREDPKEPGNFGDPLNVGQYSTEMRNKELNNGRIAMAGAIGTMSAELYTGQSVF